MIKSILFTAVRNLLKNPAYAAINLVGLAIGISTAFLIMLWVTNELSFDRFHEDADQIYSVMTHSEASGSIQTFNVAEAGMDLSGIPMIESVTRISNGTRWPHELCFLPETSDNHCVYFNGIYADASFFTTFTFPILHGASDPLTEPGSIVISSRMAKALYGSTNPVGKTFKIDGHLETKIAAVIDAPPSNSTLQFDFVLPLSTFRQLRGLKEDQFNDTFITTYIRTSQSGQQRLLTEQLNSESVLKKDLADQGLSYEAYPLVDWRLKNRFENGLAKGGRIEYVSLFVIIAILIVAMASINFINLTVARATTRGKEIGIRKVTGALRRQLVFQFMVESLLLVILASAIALVIAQTTLPFFNLITEEHMSMNLGSGAMPFYALGIILIISFISGAYPAFVLSSFQPIKVLKNNASQAATGSSSLRKSLLAVQLAVSIGIIIFSGVLFIQLKFIQEKNLGYDRKNLIRVEPTYKLLQEYEVFKTTLLADSKIESITAATDNPLDMSELNNGVSWPGKPDNERITFQTMGCSPEFFETFKLNLIDGRGFDNLEIDTAYNEVVITKNAASVMGFDDPVGQHITIGTVPCVIRGVVNDFHTQSLRHEILPVIMFRSSYVECSAIFIRYQDTNAGEVLATINKAYQKIEPTTMKYWFMDDVFDKLYKTERTAGQLILVFTAIALIISILGIIGLASFNILRRIKEIGVRRVFGASASQILSLLSKEFTGVMLIAALLAVPIAWFSAQQWLNGFVYRVDMPVWLVAATLTGVVMMTLAIIGIQGLKTATTNPSKILREE